MSKKHPPQQAKSPEKGSEQLHLPVLLDQVVELLAPQSGETYLDLTAGYGGHAKAIIDRLGSAETVTLVDRDENAIRELDEFKQAGAEVIHDDFASYAERATASAKQFDMVLVDLGVSSPQLDRAERGFSIQHEGPLDMRMDPRQEHSALNLVNRASKAELIRIIETYGEERPRQAARIALAIILARPLATTTDLSTAVLSAHRGPREKIHPATRTFQALRIATNDELGQVERLLAVVPQLLKPGGRIAIISFHSLEDRLVKRAFQELARAGYEAELELVTKKAILGKTDDVHNPRARSASLRVAVKK